jgi:hypothetical protein
LSFTNTAVHTFAGAAGQRPFVDDRSREPNLSDASKAGQDSLAFSTQRPNVPGNRPLLVDDETLKDHLRATP